MILRNPLSCGRIYWKKETDWFSKCMEWLLYFGCFFPFVQVVYTGSDTQPNALLISLAILVFYFLHKKVKMAGRFALLSAVVLFVGAMAVWGLMQVNLYDTVRAYFGYISLLVIPLATLLVFDLRGGINERLVKLVIWIWFFTGFMQRYVNGEFLYGILSRHTTNAARGVVSLSSEPSAYGYMCLFFILFAMYFEKNRLLYVANLLIQIVVFAQSSVTLVYLAAYVGMYILNELICCKKYAVLKTVALLGGGIGGLLLIAGQAREGSRIQVLVSSLFYEPEKLLKDGSITMRVEAISYSVGEFLKSGGMPHGMSQKIMSGIGTVLYELGILGVVLVILIAAVIWLGYERGERITYTFGFLIMMFSSIPFSAPIISFYLGWCLYRRKVRVQGHKTAEGEIAAVNGRNVIRRRVNWRKEHEGSVDL